MPHVPIKTIYVKQTPKRCPQCGCHPCSLTVIGDRFNDKGVWVPILWRCRGCGNYIHLDD